jgi:transposase-like protein
VSLSDEPSAGWRCCGTWKKSVSNVAATCRYYGISRQCYYGWLRRYEADGLEGLKDRSSRPHHSPNVTQAEVIEKIVWLRKHYHFGPAKIAMYLARYHDVTGSCSAASRSATCPPPSATNGERCGGSGMRSNAPGTSCRSTSNSSNH